MKASLLAAVLLLSAACTDNQNLVVTPGVAAKVDSVFRLPGNDSLFDLYSMLRNNQPYPLLGVYTRCNINFSGRDQRFQRKNTLNLLSHVTEDSLFIYSDLAELVGPNFVLHGSSISGGISVTPYFFSQKLSTEYSRDHSFEVPVVFDEAKVNISIDSLQDGRLKGYIRFHSQKFGIDGNLDTTKIKTPCQVDAEFYFTQTYSTIPEAKRPED